MNYLDLFAGAGGLSEGFIREGFTPIAHIEMSEAACYTLKTRAAFHYLQTRNALDSYKSYITGKISRADFYSTIPEKLLNSVICAEIGDNAMKCLFKQIDEKLQEQQLDLIIGGPPCQAYSLVGRARDPNGMQGDKRNYLFQYYAQFLKKYEPTYFVFENVIGLLSAKDSTGKKYFDMMHDAFEKCGYNLKYEVLSASDYGVLQNRKRIILVGKKTKTDFKFPLPEKCTHNTKVSAIFSDLPAIHSGEGDVFSCSLKKKYNSWLDEAHVRNSEIPVTFHCSRPNSSQDLEIYRRVVELWNKEHKRLSYDELPQKLKTHNNTKSFLDRFKVVASDVTASQTVVAHIAKDGHYYIHPDISQNRSITPREAARLQTFPDDYFFESVSGKPSRTEAYKQIGNAVPVLLAQKIAAKLKEVWDE